MIKWRAKISGQVVCGTWYDDNWMTPYVRLRFSNAIHASTLLANFYWPPSQREPVTVVARLGGDTLLLTEAVLPGQFVKCSAQIPRSARRSDLDVSLRTDRLLETWGKDDRDLGIVLAKVLLR